MKALLSIDSPLYLKRLARELNNRTDGFYCDSTRYFSARYRKGVLEGRRMQHNGRCVWDPIDPTKTEDVYGRSIVASRTITI